MLRLRNHPSPACERANVSTPTNEESEPSSPLVFALLADGAVVSFRTDGTPVSASPPAELPPDAMRAAGHDLAVSKDGTRVYALVPGADSVPDLIIVADRSGGAILATYLLADVGVYGALTVGPTSGHLYLFANRSGGVLLSEVDPDSGMVRRACFADPTASIGWSTREPLRVPAKAASREGTALGH